MRISSTTIAPRKARGFGLVELMVALIIGLIVIGGAISVFGVNRQTYRTTENLGRMQENGRIAFELMSRDVREAAGNACGRNLPVANVLDSTEWWRDFGDGVLGYDDAVDSPGAPFGGGAGGRVAGTDAIQLHSSSASDGVTIVSHNPSSAMFHLNVTDHDFVQDEILMACDYRQAAIFEMTGPAATNATIIHNQSGLNCTQQLGIPVYCGPGTGTPYAFGPNSMLARLSAVTWYVGNNPQGSRSLYRRFLSEPAQEIVNGVTDLQLQYALPGNDDYVDAGTVGVNGWGQITGVRVLMTTQSEEAVGTDGQVITRTLDHVVNLRNRVP